MEQTVDETKRELEEKEIMEETRNLGKKMERVKGVEPSTITLAT